MGVARIGAVASAVWCLVNSACAGVLPKSSADRQAEARAEIEAVTRKNQQAEEQRRATAEKNAQVETQRVVDEARARQQAKDRKASCSPRWRPSELEKAQRARLRPKEDRGTLPEKLSYGPSETYKTFERHAQWLEKQLAINCDVAGRAEFEVEWVYLQQEEADRVAKLKEREEQAARQQAERDAERAAFEEESTQLARKKGFARVEFGRSLADVLQTLIAEAEPVSTLRKVAIEVGAADDYFLAQQALGNGQGIFGSSDTEIRLWVVAPGTNIYEGTALPAVVSFVTVTGTKSYRNVMGSTSQAFVVKPAW